MAIYTAIADADFLDLEEIAKIQQQRWISQSAYIKTNSDFYQDHFVGLDIPDNLESLSELPLTDKEMLRNDQANHPPFGRYLGANLTDITRMHRTSGTTGTAMNLALTPADAQMTAAIGARAQKASGLGPGHKVVHCLNYQLWMGGYTDHATLEATGAMVIPYGVGGSHGLIELIRNLGVTAISCTPSYPAVLEQILRQEYESLRPEDLGLQLGLFGGEAGLDDPGFRERLQETWGFRVCNSNYGVTDVLCNFAGQSTVCNDLHFMALDVLYPELIDPDSGETRPWVEGESGELVLTHLCKEAQPLVRFRTNDIIELTGLGPAACGRTAPRFRVIGRSDDMVVVRGINVFPTMVSAVVNGIESLSGQYRIVLPQPPPHDDLPLEVELARPLQNEEAMIVQVAQTIKAKLGVTARVRLLASRHPAQGRREEPKGIQAICIVILDNSQ